MEVKMPFWRMTPERVERIKERFNVFHRGSASRYLLYGGALVAWVPKPKVLRWLDPVADFSMMAGGFAGAGSDYGVFPYKNGIPAHPVEIVKAMLNRKSKDRLEHARSAIAHLVFVVLVIFRQRKFHRRLRSVG